MSEKIKQGIRRAIESPGRMCLYFVLFAAILRLLNIYFIAGSPLFAVPTSDESEHFRLASRIAAGDWLGRHEGLMMRPPLFAWVCAAWFKVFGTSFLVTHALILISDLASIVLWYLVAVRCFSKKAAAIGGLLMCIYWPFIHFSSTGYMESFALALNGAMVLCLCSIFHEVARDNRRRLSWKVVALLLLTGLLSGLSALTRPTVLIVMPLLGLLVALSYWLGINRSWWRGLATGAILTFTTIAGMSPNAIRHWVLFNHFVPLGINGEINFHMANNNQGWGWWVNSPGIEYDIYKDTPVVIGGKPITIEGAREYWGEQNHDYLTHHFGEFLGGLGLKFLQTWNQYEIHVINDFREHLRLSPVERYALPSDIMIPLGFTGLVLSFWAVCLYIRQSRHGAMIDLAPILGQVLLCGWVILYMIGVALYHANTRHRLPALPPLVLLGGFALTEIITRLQHPHQRPGKLVAIGIILCAGIALSWLPVIPAWMPRHEDWWTHINKGTALSTLNRTDEAAREYRLAVKVMPQKLEGWRALAIASDRIGQYDSAAQAQQQLVHLIHQQYPRYTATLAEQLEKLVGFQLEAGKIPQAQASANELLQLAPNHFRAYATAAKVARAAGDTTTSLKLDARATELKNAK